MRAHFHPRGYVGHAPSLCRSAPECGVVWFARQILRTHNFFTKMKHSSTFDEAIDVECLPEFLNPLQRDHKHEMR